MNTLASTDLEVTNKLWQLGEFANIEPMKNEDPLQHFLKFNPYNNPAR